MKELKSILALLAVVLFLGACSDDTVTDPVDETFSFPLAVGNMWTYDVYELDENENMTDVKIGTNKIIIGEAVTLDGRAGFSYSEESTPDDGDEDEPNVSSISSDEDGLYIYFESFSEEEGNPLNGYSPGWVKIIDFKNSSWEALNIPIDVTDDEGNNTKGSLKMTGSSVGKVDVTYKGKSYSAMKFKTTTAINVTITSSEGSFSTDGGDDSYFVIISGIGIFETKSIETDDLTGIKGGEVELLIDHKLN